MTCFWDGILKGLKKGDYFSNTNKPSNNQQFIELCKQHKQIIQEESLYIKWNNTVLSKQEVKEHMDAINELNPSKINKGYLCSTCDCFLLFLCVFYKINVFHNYNSYTISYIYEKDTDSKKNASLFFQSDKGHFWFVSFVP